MIIRLALCLLQFLFLDLQLQAILEPHLATFLIIVRSFLPKSVGNLRRTERKERVQTNMKVHQRRRRGHMIRQGLLLKHWPCLHKAIQPHLATAPTVLKTQIRTATSQELPTTAAAQNHPQRVTRLLNMIQMSPDC